MSVVLECPGEAVEHPWACPDGKLVVRADARREEWLARREAGIGASDASGVLGLSHWTSPYEVWARKRGILPPVPDNPAMAWGRRQEPMIADHWSETHLIEVRRAGMMASRFRPWQLATVDRIAACGGLVEIKTLSHRVAHEWDDGQVPDHAEAQSQHQMAVTGRGHVHVVGLQDARTYMERLVVRDDEWIGDMTAIEDVFWHEYVLGGWEPPPGGSASATDTLNARWRAAVDVETELDGEALALVQARRDLAGQIVDLETRKAAAENRLRQLMGEATVGVLPGVDKPVTWRRNGTLRTKQLAAEQPELVEEYTRPLPGLDVAALKRDHPDVYEQYRGRVLRVPTV